MIFKGHCNASFDIFDDYIFDMESTIRVEQKLSQSIKTVKSHYERLVIKIYKVYCCSVDSNIFIQTSVSSSSIFQSEKLIKATLWQAVDIYHLSHA